MPAQLVDGDGLDGAQRVRRDLAPELALVGAHDLGRRPGVAQLSRPPGPAGVVAASNGRPRNAQTRRTRRLVVGDQVLVAQQQVELPDAGGFARACHAVAPALRRLGIPTALRDYLFAVSRDQRGIWC